MGTDACPMTSKSAKGEGVIWRTSSWRKTTLSDFAVSFISHESIVTQATYQLRHKNTEYYSWVSSGPKVLPCVAVPRVFPGAGVPEVFPYPRRSRDPVLS
jgi:hypothetical protein